VFLQRLGERLRDTVVVYSADHGEMLGDRGNWAKSRPWWQSVGIPLIIAAPGESPRICDDPVSLIDIGATFLDYAAVAPATDMTAVSLRSALSGGPGGREFVRSGLGRWRMICSRRYKAITGFDPSLTTNELSNGVETPTTPMLFDVQADPLEQQNLAASGASSRELSVLLDEPVRDG
jgi:choline-sulfatase